jgi:hypothetical protein
VGNPRVVAARPMRHRLEPVGAERTVMRIAPYIVVSVLGCGGRLADGGSEVGRANADASAASSGGGYGSSTGGSGSGGNSSGGSTSGGSVGSSGADAPPDCSSDSALNCPGNSHGYNCETNPEVPGSWLACSAPTARSDYCCMAWNYPLEPCVGDNQLTTACAATTDTFAMFSFQCNNKSDSPSTLNVALACGAGTPDPDGFHTDFCCHFE